MNFKNIIEREGKKMVTVRDYAAAAGLSIAAVHKQITVGKLKAKIDEVTGWKFILI